MKLTLILFSLTIFHLSFTDDFILQQKKYERVKKAYIEKESFLSNIYIQNHLNTNQLQVLLIAFKDEQILDLYAKNKSDKKYHKILSYEICSSSGTLGPKRKMGDGQVPEGFYYINRFNPASSYYLSLGLNYPNQVDKKKSKVSNLGGDIFIHGECVTIGCLPMTNDKIKEIYLLAIQAKQNGQNQIPVYVFPFKMTEINTSKYIKQYANDPELIQFWKNLKYGYDEFQSSLNELNVKTSNSGDYLFN